MYLFLAPLLFGFAFNLASAFTTAFARRYGERRGALLTALLRDVLGIPLWASGFLLAARASSPPLFPTSIITSAVGWIVALLGGALIVAALVTIRARAVVPSVGDSLASQGLYGCVRHPIHAGVLLEFAGIFLIIPTTTVFLACALGVLWILLQSKLEEFDLLQRLPAYRNYMSAVPALIPRFRIR